MEKMRMTNIEQLIQLCGQVGRNFATIKESLETLSKMEKSLEEYEKDISNFVITAKNTSSENLIDWDSNQLGITEEIKLTIKKAISDKRNKVIDQANTFLRNKPIQ